MEVFLYLIPIIQFSKKPKLKLVLHLLQLVSQWRCDFATGLVSFLGSQRLHIVSWLGTVQFSCLAEVEKEIRCKLQKTCYTLQSRPATCNLFKTNFMQSLQKVERSCALCNCCKPKKVARQVAKRACY